MSISFACPECRAQIEVGDEHAGHSGQCPRCQRVLVIPSPKQPQPVLVGADATPVPASDPWAKPRADSRAKPKPVDADEPRSRRSRASAPKQPAGPMWPWLVGIFAALVAATLLLSSFLVLVFWRSSESKRDVKAKDHFQKDAKPNFNNDRHVTAGRLEGGNRAVMQNGVFQIRSELHVNDLADLDHQNCRAKVYEVQLQGNRDYVMELESNHFDSEVRLQDAPRRVNLIDNGDRGGRNATIHFRPQFNDTYFVHVTSDTNGLGNFTLTIREQNAVKPGP